MSSTVHTVVLTGGPCGGKSSLLSLLTDKLKGRGVDVYCCPEVPTILISGGCVYPGENAGQKLIDFETGLIELQMQIEDSFLKIASSTGRPSVVVMDRGLLDIPAYLPPKQWDDILIATGLDEKTLAKRYGLVVHLVSAADGAELFYTTSNNAARTETAEQARELDMKIKGNWARAHNNVALMDNSTDFQEKCRRGSDAILAYIDTSPGIQFERKPNSGGERTDSTIKAFVIGVAFGVALGYVLTAVSHRKS
uniref:NadR/Ttd14 AAA domain-containing protein n=1 Tax=Octactis speculum TaxID=3111310 RepID=A0A7S2DHA1_9STRA|mmetsp:Transcript_49093/g.66903  ORF Transcript_49093/g.66903 Transcript_49093/m.66903 type:complete len:252 (+) Transcript_49093:134-889(+)|eukprot:CAMPEP_0185755036 /NCGR_PEP_ID=MMETSP1174-20130828/13588_1 /TAXON_ID=35687 /ORGANISM="Dictyocha speculum, Strain CCMP1381" /LENGTH=251 /DNA_ID=CAMNT_0028433457 /DNA_START=134 /DNA_END=889 /DNA_ORIENTATION=+